MSRATRRGAQAAAGGAGSAKKTVSYTFTSMPAGTIDIAFDSGTLDASSIAGGNRLSEGSRITGSGAIYAGCAMPDIMGTNFFSVTVGNANASSSSRGIGAGCFNSDFSVGVFFFVSGNTTNCQIFTWIGGVSTPVASSSSVHSTSSSDQLALIPSVSGGVVTWTVYKNGTPTAVTWTDDSHIIDLPGKRCAVTWRHEYTSGTNYPSPGAKSFAAVDL